ncbi:hypothetical protein AWC32_08165 [Mycobacterium xenopi]|uniref:Uncharacterized protein n=2 Tax=Mycobacterium xenopi TaxID=1789 RepID=A0AAD1H3F4_MYCXE|nr:hypothetical protein I553_2139 [Mycobacterium xenopi 4042]ORX19948.1 hypothetical protein AWC32_08165 [Mycobacterium xenopi]BBU24469.1 hypothetical protein MYXE_42590 [Mycobacterium xenopi]SPX90236.1 Uncharacterised protein [Mycobacterium xenopi]
MAPQRSRSAYIEKIGGVTEVIAHVVRMVSGRVFASLRYSALRKFRLSAKRFHFASSPTAVPSAKVSDANNDEQPQLRDDCPLRTAENGATIF